MSPKNKGIIEKNIQALMNVINKDGADCDDNILLLCFDNVMYYIHTLTCTSAFK